MRGLEGKEFEALKKFVELKALTTNGDVTPELIGEPEATILTKIFQDYSRGFIACEMRRIIENGA